MNTPGEILEYFHELASVWLKYFQGENLMQELSGKIQDEQEEAKMLVKLDQEFSQEDFGTHLVLPKSEEKREKGGSRIGITKKVYRPAAEKKARKLAKKMRKANRRK